MLKMETLACMNLYCCGIYIRTCCAMSTWSHIQVNVDLQFMDTTSHIYIGCAVNSQRPSWIQGSLDVNASKENI